MHPFFEPLSDREAMLLLTTLTVGGKDEVGLFERMPPESAQRLREKADALLAIAADKRVAFMVNQMKQAFKQRGLRGVEKVDPSWLIQGLHGEMPRVVAGILVTLPAPVIRAVVQALPPKIRQALPPKDELREVPPEIIRTLRQLFESRFHAMPRASGKAFRFCDIIHLEPEELHQLMRDLGLVELGQAFVAVGKLALAELCRRLPRSKAEELIFAVRRASKLDAPDLKTAQRFLSRVVVNFEDTEEFFQKAGLWRVAKACLIESAEFRAAFQQRVRRDLGELFDTFLEKAGEMDELNEEVLHRLQDAIVVRVKSLSETRVLSPHWAQLDLGLHDADFLAKVAAMEAPPPEPAVEAATGGASNSEAET